MVFQEPYYTYYSSGVQRADDATIAHCNNINTFKSRLKTQLFTIGPQNNIQEMLKRAVVELNLIFSWHSLPAPMINLSKTLFTLLKCKYYTYSYSVMETLHI